MLSSLSLETFVEGDCRRPGNGSFLLCRSIAVQLGKRRWDCFFYDTYRLQNVSLHLFQYFLFFSQGDGLSYIKKYNMTQVKVDHQVCGIVVSGIIVSGIAVVCGILV